MTLIASFPSVFARLAQVNVRPNRSLRAAPRPGGDGQFAEAKDVHDDSNGSIWHLVSGVTASLRSALCDTDREVTQARRGHQVRTHTTNMTTLTQLSLARPIARSRVSLRDWPVHGMTRVIISGVCVRDGRRRL